MIIFDIVNNKLFMNLLLKNSVFDTFEVRNIEIQTFTNFQISGLLEKSYFSLDEQELILRKYCLWSELKPIIFQLLKGDKTPKFIKIVFSYNDHKINEICENSAALFLNVIFENSKISCITGSSEKNFSLEKKVESSWDNYMKNFFKINNLNV